MTLVYVLLAVAGAFVALMLGLRIALVLRASRMQGRPAPALAGKAGRYVASGKAGLFYFYSPSCGACSSMTPVVRRLEHDRDGVFPIDISRDMETARKFGVMATPTTIAVRDGLVQQVLIGPQPAPALEALV